MIHVTHSPAEGDREAIIHGLTVYMFGYAVRSEVQSRRDKHSRYAGRRISFDSHKRGWLMLCGSSSISVDHE